MERLSANISPHVKESKTVLDSGLHVVDSGFEVPDSGVIVNGMWIPVGNGVRIP